MEFKAPYLQAMIQQVPAMFKRLRQTGALDAHLDQKAAEAKRLLDQMLEGEPRHPSGAVKNVVKRLAAEEQVRAMLIEFPPESPRIELRGDPLAIGVHKTDL